jgi:GNAT superfamily N-acetyltransferase
MTSGKPSTGYELRPPTSTDEWDAYHAIRRHVLFELRGRGSAYDPNHPDDSRPGNYPLVLFSHRDGPLGVIRIDVDRDCATFRRVAIRADEQRRGHGRVLIECAEEFARQLGCRRVESIVDAHAIAFYERCGFQRSEPEGGDARAAFMSKDL